MKIDAIRPEYLAQEQQRAYSQDVARYQLSQHEFKNRSCPACSQTENQFFSTHQSFTFVCCVSCHCVYMNPGPTASIVADLYAHSANYKFWGEYVYPQSRESRLATLHSNRSEWILESIAKHLPQKDSCRILEIGAGTGDTLVTLRKQSNLRLETFAIELNPDMRPHLENNGIEVLDKTLQEISKELDKFDVIVMFEVLEHLLEPTEMFDGVRANLIQGGLFMFSTPNASSLEVQWLRDRSTTLDIEHISVLTPASVTHLAINHQFTIQDIRTPGQLDLELMNRGNIDISISIDSDQKSATEMQEIISNSFFSSHMKVILQQT